jgi:hypothetical protein
MNGYEWMGVSEQLYWSCLEVDWRMVEEGEEEVKRKKRRRKETKT